MKKWFNGTAWGIRAGIFITNWDKVLGWILAGNLHKVTYPRQILHAKDIVQATGITFLAYLIEHYFGLFKGLAETVGVENMFYAFVFSSLLCRYINRNIEAMKRKRQEKLKKYVIFWKK